MNNSLIGSAILRRLAALYDEAEAAQDWFTCCLIDVVVEGDFKYERILSKQRRNVLEIHKESPMVILMGTLLPMIVNGRVPPTLAERVAEMERELDMIKENLDPQV